MTGSQPTTVLAEHRICERMLLALNAPVTESNIARLGFFAGILSSMNANSGNLDAIEALIMGFDMQNVFNRHGNANHLQKQAAGK